VSPHSALRAAVRALHPADDSTKLKQVLEEHGIGNDEYGNAFFPRSWRGPPVTLADLKEWAPVVARFSFCEQDWARESGPRR